MCVWLQQFDINLHGFLYGDFEYFNWFAQINNDEGKADRFHAVLQWKRLIRYLQEAHFQQIWNNFNNGHVNNYRIVTRVFLEHLQEPINYPLFDKNVWRAMRYLIHNIPANTPENSNEADFHMHYMQIYVPFFNGIFQANENNIICPQIDGVGEEIVKRRVIDRALWEYGSILNNNQQA